VWTTTPDSDVLEPTIRSPVGGKAVAEETFARAEQDREDPDPVFVGGSGALYHAIHRRERRQHQLSHTSYSSGLGDPLGNVTS
jgi:hypothetical protein